MRTVLRCIKPRQFHSSRRLTDQSVLQSQKPPSKFDESLLAKPTWSVVDLLERKKRSVNQTENNIQDDTVPIVTEELIQRLGALCYLHIPTTSNESSNPAVNMKAMRESVQSMIGWMSTINHVECDAADAIYTPLQIMDEYMTVTLDHSIQTPNRQPNHPAVVVNRLREDQIDMSTCVRVTELAPHSDRGFIAVPKVVDIDE